MCPFQCFLSHKEVSIGVVEDDFGEIALPGSICMQTPIWMWSLFAEPFGIVLIKLYWVYVYFI